MHNKAVAVYERDVVDEVRAFLHDAAGRCVRAGIPAEHVILDPGIGFGKLPEHNLALLGALDRLVALGFPTLIGTSRKSTIGKLTGRSVDERAFGTAATVALAVAAGSTSCAFTTSPSSATSCASPTRSCAAGAPTAGPNACRERSRVRVDRAARNPRLGPARRERRRAGRPAAARHRAQPDRRRGRRAQSDALADTIDYAALHARSYASSRRALSAARTARRGDPRGGHGRRPDCAGDGHDRKARPARRRDAGRIGDHGSRAGIEETAQARRTE